LVWFFIFAYALAVLLLFTIEMQKKLHFETICKDDCGCIAALKQQISKEGDIT